MKILLLPILFFSFLFHAAGQTKPSNITVRGVVVDSLTKSVLGYCTTTIQDAATKQSIRSTLTKEDGSFELIAPVQKAYLLVIVYVGYADKVIAVSDTGKVINLGKIMLSPATRQLAGVSITAVKPLMKQEVDRLSYDVQADPESTQITALDMMRKVPLLSVDATDNIKLRGSGAFKILINGKESALLANNPSDILKAMPASNIIKIEVITTPPAKYDAEGLAGIINIITKKNTGQAYNVSVNGRYNNIHGAGLNLNGTVQAGKFGYSGNVGTEEQRRIGTEFENLSTFTTATPSSLTQTGTKYFQNRNTYNSNELSYEADSLNLFSITFNYFNSNNTPGNTSFSSQYNANNLLTQAYRATDNGTSAGTGTDLGFNYQLGFKHNKDELLTASYRYNNNSSNQFDDNVIDQTFNYKAPNFRQYNSSGSKEYTTQLDFIDPLKAFTIEAGGKMILRDNFSNFHTDTLNTASGRYFTNSGQTNDFIYHQNVYSLYNSYLFRLNKWTFKGGLRLEHTKVSANFSTTSSVFERYDNLVPSVSIKRDLSTVTSLVFGFTQRIQRPGITQLNPFVNMSNPLFISVGNPNLTPSVNNAFELNYSYSGKGSVNVSTHYSFSNNNIQNVVSVDSQNVTTTSFANIGQYKNLGIDINVNYSITKKMNINVNSELLRVWLAGVYKGSAYGNSGQQGHIFTFTSYRFDKGLRIGVNVGFDSRYVLLQGVDNFYFNNAYNISQELFNKKGSVFITAANLFRQYNKLDFFTQTPDFVSYNANNNPYRNFGFGFNYRFGKLASEIKKNKRGINNDDASGGRGN